MKKKKKYKTKSILDGKILVWKLGSDERPATNQDIDRLAKQLKKLFKKQKITSGHIVTHNLLTLEVY